MATGRDPLRVTIHLVVYVALYYVTAAVFSGLFVSLAGTLAGVTLAGLVSAWFANWLSLRIYEDRHVMDIGLWLNRWSGENLMLGVIGGAGTATLVLGPPLLLRVAHLVSTPKDQPGIDTVLFVGAILVIGAAHEELLFRGYGFQELISATGAWATVLPVGVVFALMHGSNPGAGRLSAANTAGFGILFGYAYLRSRDLWLPIGLHFGWNFTLTMFGVNVSGLKMKVTGYEMIWNVGDLWSGGAYGPEASVLTSVVLVALAVYLVKAPVRRQVSPLTDPPAESALCESSPSLRS